LTVVQSQQLFIDDVQAFGQLPGVTVHDIAALSPEALREVFDGPGVTIGGFCNSKHCLFFNAVQGG